METSKYKRTTRPPSRDLAAAVKRALKEGGEDAASEALGVTAHTLTRMALGLPCRATTLEVVGRRLGLDAKASGAVE